MNRETCVKILQDAELSDLWNYFLKGQAELFFRQERELLSKDARWVEARDVLELGSGNGAYLSCLAESFKDKTWLGVEKKPEFVVQASEKYGRSGLAFREGDAEVENDQFRNRFDVVLFRLTLQHLQNPERSLELAHGYLKPGGCIVIIDSYDPARSGSHVMHSFEDAFRQHNERNQAAQKVNRRISMEILEGLENKSGLLSSLFEVARTSLDVEGNRLEKGMRFETKQDRMRYFNHALLFLGILNKGYGVTVDFPKAHDELQVYLKDETSWISPGMHLLVLKKR